MDKNLAFQASQSTQTGSDVTTMPITVPTKPGQVVTIKIEITIGEACDVLANKVAVTQDDTGTAPASQAAPGSRQPLGPQAEGTPGPGTDDGVVPPLDSDIPFDPILE